MFMDYVPLTIPGGAYSFSDARRGEPGVPTRVLWKGHERLVTRVTRLPRTTGSDRGGSAERYADRHWYILELDDGTRLEAYFMRRARKPGETRWWAQVHREAAGDA
jgi:hypothetical protein